MDNLSWETAEVVSPCLPRSLWSHIVIRVFLLLGTVCPRHPPYPVLPSCPISRAFTYPQHGDAGGRRSTPAICQSPTSADPTINANIVLYSKCCSMFTLTKHNLLYGCDHLLAICHSGCTVASSVVGGICNHSHVRTSKCTCLIFGVSTGLDPG